MHAWRHSGAAMARRSMAMITDEQDAQLGALREWVLDYKPAGKTRRQFWQEFDEQAGDLPRQAWSEAADEDLRERYVDVVSLADDRGFAGPDEIVDRLMR